MKTLNHNDRSGKGLLSEGEVKRVCKAVGLPIHHDLLTALISKFPKTEGMVDHVKFIEDLKSAEKLGRFFKLLLDLVIDMPWPNCKALEAKLKW